MDWIEEELTFFEFAQKFVGINDMSNPQNINIESLGIEIETLLPNGKIGFAPMNSFIVKESVPYHWQLGELKGSGAHRVLYKNEWITLDEHPESIMIKEPINIVDTSVEETQNYIANGQVNHNTVPGGKSIPFHSSVRIKLGAGQKIEDSNKNIVGIHVSAKTIKNKIAAPFRECKFEIHFGKGIKEDEQIFDILRLNGPELVDDKVIEVSGAASWKYLKVRNLDNELLVDKKFRKSEFPDILKDPELGKYCDDLLEKAMVKLLNADESFNFDPEAYEEARSIVMETEEELIDPEK